MSSKVSKVVNIILMLVIAGPIIYGLYVNDFDIQKFLQFDFQTIRVEATFHLVDIFVEDDFRLIFRALNNGNVPLNITVLEVNLNIVSPQYIMNMSTTPNIGLGPIEPGDYQDFEVELTPSVPPEKFPRGRYTIEIELIVEIEYQGEVFRREVEFTANLTVG